MSEFKAYHSELNKLTTKTNFKFEVASQSLPPPKYRITSGDRSFDLALGGNPIVGYGNPTGRIIELYGGESTGKSTIAAHMMYNFQALSGLACLIESEESTTSERLVNLGTNPDEIFNPTPKDPARPVSLEDGYTAIDQFISIGASKKYINLPKIIVWDTVTSAPSNAEIANGMYAGGMAEAPRIHSTSLRCLMGKLAKTNTLLVLVSQTRESIGSYAGGASPPGGKAIKFYAAIRVALRNGGRIEGDDSISAIQTIAKVVKNKTDSPFLSSILHINNKHGLDLDRALFANLMNGKYFRVSGSWLYIDDFGNEPIAFQSSKFMEKLNQVEGLRNHLIDRLPFYIRHQKI